MKMNELRKCDLCQRRLGTTFYEVGVKQHLLDYDALGMSARQHAFLGGLTAAMGTDPDVTAVVNDHTVIVCLSCVTRSVAELVEAGEEE